MFLKSKHEFVPIKGIQKTTLIDFPGKLACTIFIGGCNLRCGYCYNSDLVFSNLPSIGKESVITFLRARRRYIEGVCITGGEPTLYPGLSDFCAKIKSLGYLIKLDTNGTNPSAIRNLISCGLVDYIAMDVKCPIDSYGIVAGTNVSRDAISESISIIMDSGISYEFRTTAIPDVINMDAILKISATIKGAKSYFIQQFRPDQKAIGQKYRTAEPLPAEKLMEFKKAAEKYILNVGLRGI
ncbi:anaerobic ribonucleoside-triphosphate reductase activating protein [Candidatus Woesearchaeota archaeon]|nr:anaerobic ribonucleoside-triphosphate reductase activating protein [Candidatus Woesearchaeota archaeon]